MTFTREDYRATVKCYADDLISDCRNGRIRSAEALREAAEEVVDGSQWIIYTGRASVLLGFTRNPDAAEDALGWEALSSGAGSFDELVTRKAFYAMLADVEEAVNDADDFDANDPETWMIHERDPEDDGFTYCGADPDEVPEAEGEAVTCPDCLRYRARRLAQVETPDASA